MTRISLLALVLAAAPAQASPLRVASLSTVLTEIAREVGGTEVRVGAVLKPGVDPHSFEPSPADMREIADADVILACGFGIEGYLDKLATNVNPRATLFRAADALGDRVVFTDWNGRRFTDPHWWNSLDATATVAKAVAGVLGRRDPASSDVFARRAGAYVARLERLRSWADAELAAIPKSRRVLVTTHAAFGWFSRDFGFEVRSITGGDTEAEPDARDFAALVEFVRTRGIPAVFAESSESPRLAAALARETGSRIGGELYADGLSPDGDGTTFEGMFRHNVETIVKALRPL